MKGYKAPSQFMVKSPQIDILAIQCIYTINTFHNQLSKYAISFFDTFEWLM